MKTHHQLANEAIAALKQARIYRVRVLMALRAAERSKGPLRWQAPHLRNTLATLDYMVSHESTAHCLMPVHGDGIEDSLRSFEYHKERNAA